jgi:formate hydrogenlyase subunit 4
MQVLALAAAPILPGLVQSLKARLQGRRGPGPLQPFRELARLWQRSVVAPEGAGVAYRMAPAVIASSLIVAVLMVPFAGEGLGWPAGTDALVLISLLALGRVAAAASAWDTGNGFALMGAARDLTFAVAGEALLVLVLLVAALPAGSTDLGAMWSAAAGVGAWDEPARWCGAFGMALVVVLETGRQPIDNPDTHLELTMVHEGPLLEHAGRDLALLQWAAAARHLLVIALAVGLYLPHPAAFWPAVGAMVAGAVVVVIGLALLETWQVKMRVLAVPRLLAAGSVVTLAGLVTWLAGAS